MMRKHLGTVRVRHLLTIALIAVGLPLLTMGPASAHTPNLAKDCYGITVSGSSYETKDTNTLGIRIDGGTWTTKTFGTGGSLTVPLPQDGQGHSYDAYVHTTNQTASYSQDYSGTIRACGKTHVTAVLFEKTDPTCAADGTLVTKSEPAGITVHQTPSGTGPGHYTITFEAQTGYVVDGPTSQTIDVLPKLTADQCATVVQPVAPTITEPACTGPGTGTPGSFTLPPDGGGISYSKSGDVVTATADATHKFVSLPAGWTPVDAHHATYTVSYQAPDGYPACLEPLPVPVPPVASQPTCDTDGSLTVSPTDHVVTTVDGDVITEETQFGPGDHEIVYAPAAGYAFVGEAQTTFTRTVAPATADCPVTPVAPTLTQSACIGAGTHSAPVVTFGDVEGDHITYAYLASGEFAGTVTAAAETGFALADLPEGWVGQEDGTATYAVTFTDPGDCAVTVVSPPTSPPVVKHPQPPASLPNTGGTSPWLPMTGLGLLLAGGALVARDRRRRES